MTRFRIWIAALVVLSALFLAGGSAAASDARIELYDIAKPFTPGASVVSDMSAHGFIGEYQVGVVGGRNYRILPDGSAAFGINAVMVEDRVDVICDRKAKLCTVTPFEGEPITVKTGQKIAVDFKQLELPSVELAKAYASKVTGQWTGKKVQGASKKRSSKAKAKSAGKKKSGKAAAKAGSKKKSDKAKAAAKKNAEHKRNSATKA